jgi:hypothetical protein
MASVAGVDGTPSNNFFLIFKLLIPDYLHENEHQIRGLVNNLKMIANTWVLV